METGTDFNRHVDEGNRCDEEVMEKFGSQDRNSERQMVFLPKEWKCQW